MRKWYGVLDWPLHAITLVQKYRKSFLFYLQLQDNGKASDNVAVLSTVARIENFLALNMSSASIKKMIFILICS